MSPTIAKVSGWLLAGGLLISIISAITNTIHGYWAGVPIWLTALLFFPYAKPSQKKQITLLLFLGSIGIIIGVINHVESSIFLNALEANQKVINMLIAVGFLKIFITGTNKISNELPTGKKALITTLLSAHLFGAVLNMSSVIIVGDRIAKANSLNPVQGLLLLRAFCICAFWSPFFAAMGLTLVSSPGSELSTLILYGIPVSLSGIIVSIWEIIRQPNSKDLQGYPIAIGSLWMPCLLAFLVILVHELAPKLSVLTLVSLISVSFTLIGLLLTQKRAGMKSFVKHIETGVANSSGEVVLFAAAALLASGMAAILTSLQWNIAPAHFGHIEASVTLLILILLALIGMHPVTSVALAGSILAPAVNDPNLLGLTLLMGWSLGIGLSPFSGVQISIQSRYNISAQTLLKLNWRYALVMYGCCYSMLWFYSLNHL
ncbi:hypothetical protein [Vibrio salinus]|uniref:hypothetical protein n=1 Tax=Vibrio salinus TaxID=2899784 RepID=UPI001E4452C7|nr:hypothetical protein [Vibrio salinus]MCE0495269.1 hypothetical protein [Vibrio salinus]